MKIDILVPAAGESVTEADIASWAKGNGDFVEMDDVLLELETDKASLELTAEQSGKLEILVEEGETVQVGQVIARIDTSVSNDAGKVNANNPEKPKKDDSENSSKKNRQVFEILVPAAGESVTEADIASWSKENGDFVEMDEVILELETDKASLELTAEGSGKLEILVEEGNTVQVGQVIGKIYAGESSNKKVEQKAEPASINNDNSKTENSTSYAKGHASPSAAKLMAENNISLSEGSGKDGRVTKADALDAVSKKGNKKDAGDSASTVKSLAADSSLRNQREEKMSRIRKTISRRLVEAQQTAALLTTFNEVDMTAVMEIRKKYKDSFKEKHNIGLGFMSFFTKATSAALLEFPILNAQLNEENIVYYDYTDIGIAVATPKGLVVPVLRNVEKMSFLDVEQEIRAYALKGRDGSLTPDDMSGWHFYNYKWWYFWFNALNTNCK
jgi:2-oxoglutarate dehydrogenase E2 component (dihydrolipoamide succinyltransferase)